MIIALDKDDKRIHIEDTKSNQTYYCPYCGTELIVKKGDIRAHHFAHKNHQCKDSWERDGFYDMSSWHCDWQNKFPLLNQEIALRLGEAQHRADVLIGRTVIEFQRSILSSASFDNRNNFYLNLEYKVVWLFDIEDLIIDKKVTFTEQANYLKMHWDNPKKAFNAYDVKEGKIDLFFQLYDAQKNEKCIVRVLDVSESGFEEFTSSCLMTKEEFFEYVGYINGKCILPDRMDLTLNENYQKFKKKYDIKLNKQQERAMISVEGNNLLLAVPGSGKTTVLVQRLGYMIYEKHIDPSSIICLTFGKDATDEMKKRFEDKFGTCKINFSTINSISSRIYNDYCTQKSVSNKMRIDKNRINQIKKSILKKRNSHVSSDYITEFTTAISYAKNMMLDKEQAETIDDYISSFSVMLGEYNNELKKQGLMDFDDQMRFAYAILKGNSEIAKEWKTKYKYICVDEAQDTSKIQHEIIRLLSEKNNLFMVGDEDQSIYGFRAAYPKALLNFRTDYKNPYILKMEINYRCTPEIVEKAQTFISKNTGRYKKRMTTNNPSGSPVELIKVDDFTAQYNKCLEVAKEANVNDKEVAFLYRDNVSSIVLFDLFLRNCISFSLKKPEYNFFNGLYVSAIIGCLKLALNPRQNVNANVIRVLNKTGYLHMHDKTIDILCDKCKYKDFYVALLEQMEYVKCRYRHDGENLKENLGKIKSMSSYDAIMQLIHFYHNDKVSNEFQVLLELAKNEKNISSFINRIDYLKATLNKDINYQNSKIILSTIHTAKGKEFENVYLIDVFDGRFPSSNRNYFNGSKDVDDGEQEERRLFYVALTRAKKNLSLFAINSKYSSYLEELFPGEQKVERKENGVEFLERPIIRNRERYDTTNIVLKLTEKVPRRSYTKEQTEAIHQEKTKEELETKKKKDYEDCFDEVKDKLNQQEKEVYDHHNRRWIKCENCNLIAPIDKFQLYGGEGKLNLGICPKCLSEKYK